MHEAPFIPRSFWQSTPAKQLYITTLNLNQPELSVDVATCKSGSPERVGVGVGTTECIKNPHFLY